MSCYRCKAESLFDCRCPPAVLPPADALAFKSVPSGMEVRYKLRDLVGRAVRNAKPTKPGKHPRWHAVGDAFALGSTFATQLCQQFGVDPDEQLEGPACEFHDEEEE